MASLYGDLTAEALLDRMLDRYRLEFDKREGSLTWDEFANVAIELRLLYIQLDWQWRQMFGDTAERAALIRLAADRDIKPQPASAAVIEGAFNIPIAEGERFNLGDYNYMVYSSMESPDELYHYLLRCETVGSVGNMTFGDLVPIRNIPGLVTSEVVAVAIPGEDEEETEAFRERYYETLRHAKYGFNVAEYQSQVNLIPGVGAVRTYPADPDAGHVRVVILDSLWLPATPTLVAEVQEILDPVPYRQQGMGRAPVGHFVSVQTAATATIDIQMTVTIAPETNWEAVHPLIMDRLEDYLLELRQGWEKAYDPVLRTQTGMTVRQAHIDTRILEVPGVIDVTNTLINGVDGNYNPPLDAVPILGTVTNA